MIASIFLESISYKSDKIENISYDILLENNVKQQFKKTLNLEKLSYSDPYWLQTEGSLGMYNVNKKTLIGKPETPRKAVVFFNLLIGTTQITFKKNIIHNTVPYCVDKY